MKLIKIKENHYVIVDDSEIKEGDFVYDSKDKVIRFVKQYLPDEWIKKITHSTQFLEGVKQLVPSDIPIEIIGEVDVEKKAKKYTEERNYLFEEEQGYVAGYNECLEDNKDKKYTRNEVHMLMCKAFEQGWKKADVVEAGLEGLETDVECTWILTRHDSTPTPTEWEVEFNTNGKLKLI